MKMISLGGGSSVGLQLNVCRACGMRVLREREGVYFVTSSSVWGSGGCTSLGSLCLVSDGKPAVWNVDHRGCWL